MLRTLTSAARARGPAGLARLGVAALCLVLPGSSAAARVAPPAPRTSLRGGAPAPARIDGAAIEAPSAAGAPTPGGGVAGRSPRPDARPRTVGALLDAALIAPLLAPGPPEAPVNAAPVQGDASRVFAELGRRVARDLSRPLIDAGRERISDSWDDQPLLTGVVVGGAALVGLGAYVGWELANEGSLRASHRFEVGTVGVGVSGAYDVGSGRWTGLVRFDLSRVLDRAEPETPGAVGTAAGERPRPVPWQQQRVARAVGGSLEEAVHLDGGGVAARSRDRGTARHAGP